MADEPAAENEHSFGEIIDRMQQQMDDLQRRADRPPEPDRDADVPEHTNVSRVLEQPNAIIPQGSIPPPPTGAGVKYFLYAQDGVLFWQESTEC